MVCTPALLWAVSLITFDHGSGTVGEGEEGEGGGGHFVAKSTNESKIESNAKVDPVSLNIFVTPPPPRLFLCENKSVWVSMSWYHYVP